MSPITILLAAALLLAGRVTFGRSACAAGTSSCSVGRMTLLVAPTDAATTPEPAPAPLLGAGLAGLGLLGRRRRGRRAP